jgi:purine-binding chemotaxis protein CheW
MVQRNAGQQSQGSMGSSGRLENQIAQMAQMVSARAMATSGTSNESGAGEQYLVFSLLDRDFAFPAETVQGVERLGDVTAVPHVAPWIAGVINLRGSICSVVDLRSFLDMEQLPFNPRTRLLSVKYNEMLVCLVVDSVSEMVPISPRAIDSNLRSIPSWASTYSSGLAAVGKRRVILLDAGRLLFSDKMHHYSA